MRSSRRLAPTRASYVIRATDDAEARPARMGADLTQTQYAPVGVADPRLVDPYLAELVEQAREEARREGFEAGRVDGFEAGRREGLAFMDQQQRELVERDAQERTLRRERLAELLQAVESALVSALDQQAPSVAELQHVVSTLAVDIAEALVGHHLSVGDCAARDAVMRALTQIPRHAAVTLRLNPADLEEVTAITGDITEWKVGRVQPDPTLARGDVVALAENLEVESTLQDALSRVRQALGL